MWWDNYLERVEHGHDDHDYASQIIWEQHLPRKWWNDKFTHVDNLRDDIYDKLRSIFSASYMEKHIFEVKELSDEILHLIIRNLRSDLINDELE